MSDTPKTSSKWEELCCSGQSWYTIAEYMKEDCQDLERELNAARAEIERLDTAGIHSCHKNCQRPNCVLRRELKAVTEQRDRLAEALKSIASGAVYEDKCILIAREALQSLTRIEL